MHSGHRARLIGKVEGDSVVYQHELLEILLFYACPRKDMNPAAHLLIERFGDLNGVFGASFEELISVDGIGENIARYIVCLSKCLNKVCGSLSFAVINSTEQFLNFMKTRPVEDRDTFEICMLDDGGRIRRICEFTAAHGAAGISESKILKSISVYRAYGIFAAYKRVCADPTPNEADDALVKKIIKCCKLCGVRLYDYCIISSGGNAFSYYVTDRLATTGGETI